MAVEFPQPAKGLGPQVVDLSLHPPEVIGPLVRELRIGKLNPFLTLSKPSKEERKHWECEEPLLGLFAVLVHCISHQSEVHWNFGDERVILVVTM